MGEMPKWFNRAVRRPASEMRVDLRQRRMWFDGEGDDGGDPPVGDGKYNPETMEDANKIISALVKRLDERDAEFRSYKQQADERLTAAQAAEKRKLEEEGNYKALLDQSNAEINSLKPYKDRTEALEGLIRAQNDALINQLPEDRRDIVPVDLPPDKLFNWLTKSVPMLTKPLAPNLDGGAGEPGGKPSQSLTPDQKAMAQRFGVSEEDFAAQLKKRGE